MRPHLQTLARYADLERRISGHGRHKTLVRDPPISGRPRHPARPAPVLPEIPWEPNRIWIWDATHFTRCDRSVYAIVDVVSRFWIETLVTTEQTSTQVQLLFSSALESQGLLDTEGRPIRRPPGGTDDMGGPVLVAWSDNGPEMRAGDTRTFVALMAIV